MKAKAPEKIYIEPNLDSIWGMAERSCESEIEYTRTDMVLDWIKNKAESYIVDTPLCSYFDYKRAVEDFKNYMKGK